MNAAPVRHRLTRLEVENFKRITAVAIEPKGNVVEISGPNGAGKSSVLDAMWTLFKGLSVAPVEPIRKGAERAVIRGRLGDLIVTRTFRRKEEGGFTSDMKITNPDGAVFPAAQKKLDALIGDRMLDPHDFLNRSAREQFDALRSFVPDVDFDAIDAAQRGDYERRTDLNRQAREKRIRAQSIVVPVDTPEKPLDESALVGELEAAGKHNLDIEQRKANRAEVARRIERAIANVTAHEARIAELEEEIQDVRQRADSEKLTATQLQAKLAEVPPLPEPIDTTQVRARIDQAKTVNAHVRLLDERMQLHAEAAELEKQSEQITARMDERTKGAQEKIAAAKLPVPGIGFGSGHLTLNGVPFEQASSGERLRTAFALAVSQNPKFPLVWIRDGSLLDDANLAIVAQLAEEFDCHVWLETVRATNGDAIVLEDGHVKQEVAKAEAAA